MPWAGIRVSRETEQGMPAPFLLRLRLPLIEHVRVDEQEDGGTDQRHEQEPEGGHSAEDPADERQDARCHEQDRADAVRFIPNPVIGERPRSTDADEEVTLRLAEHEPDEDEEQSHCRKHGCAHLEIGVTQVPRQ